VAKIGVFAYEVTSILISDVTDYTFFARANVSSASSQIVRASSCSLLMVLQALSREVLI
jgi:hypothetical protein